MSNKRRFLWGSTAALGIGILGWNLISNDPTPNNDINTDIEPQTRTQASSPITVTDTDTNPTTPSEQVSKEAFLNSCFTNALLATDNTLTEEDLLNAYTLLFPDTNSNNGKNFTLWESSGIQQVETDAFFHSQGAEFKVNITGERTSISYVSSLSKDGSESQLNITPQMQLSMRIGFNAPENIISQITNSGASLNSTSAITDRDEYDEQIAGIEQAINTIKNSIFECANQNIIQTLPKLEKNEEITDDTVESCIASSIAQTKRETEFSDIYFYSKSHNDNGIEFQVTVQGKRVPVDVQDPETSRFIRNLVTPNMILTIQEPFAEVTLEDGNSELDNEVLDNSTPYFEQKSAAEGAANTMIDHLKICIPELRFGH